MCSNPRVQYWLYAVYSMRKTHGERVSPYVDEYPSIDFKLTSVSANSSAGPLVQQQQKKNFERSAAVAYARYLRTWKAVLKK